MSKTVFLALLALVCSVAAHAGHGGDMPYGWRNTRAVTASSCTAYTCAIKGGNCAGDNTYCMAGEYCGADNMCTTQVAKLRDACDVKFENVCIEGSCIDGFCQKSREIMPGNACESDGECFFSDTVDGNGAQGACVSGVCIGRAVDQECVASHQCNAGLFCSSTKTCRPLSGVNGACSADNECDSNLNCVSGQCIAHFTVAENGACETTNDCSSGLYCNPSTSTCARAVATSSSAVCDISSNDCPAGHECACRGIGQQATCAAYPGTADNMVNIERDALSCLASNKCGTTTNSTFVDCVNKKCAKQFCSYFTRSMVDLYSMPECVRARALDNAAFANLVKTCSAYAPGQKSSAGVISASMFLVALVSAVALLF